MAKLTLARQDYECDRCFGIIKQFELHEYIIVKNPAELQHSGNDQYTICHFHSYDCLNEKPPVETLQEIDLKNIARHGQSNNQI